LPSRIELEIVRVINTPQATHIRYRVRRWASGYRDANLRVVLIVAPRRG